MNAAIELGTQEDGTVVYREARSDHRRYLMEYTVKTVAADKLEDGENLPFHAWPGGYKMAYYVVADNLTDGPYCASCAHDMARSGNYYAWEAEESGGILAECTDSWDCPRQCEACPAMIGPEYHCGPRNPDGDCNHCGSFIAEGEETAL